MAMTKERLEEAKLWPGYLDIEGVGGGPEIVKELIAEVERLQSMECRIKKAIVELSDGKIDPDRPFGQQRVAEDPALKNIRQARTRGHGERPGAA